MWFRKKIKEKKQVIDPLKESLAKAIADKILKTQVYISGKLNARFRNVPGIRLTILGIFFLSSWVIASVSLLISGFTRQEPETILAIPQGKVVNSQSNSLPKQGDADSPLNTEAYNLKKTYKTYSDSLYAYYRGLIDSHQTLSPGLLDSLKQLEIIINSIK